MSARTAKFPEAVFLRRQDGTGYGFFFVSEDDFRQASDSFTKPILRSFDGPPLPGQPAPEQHLSTAISTFIGQAFDHAVSGDVGAEGVSRAVAACVRRAFPGPVPRVVSIDRRDGRIKLRPGIEFMRHPGYPLAVVVAGCPHGGEAHFFASPEAFQTTGERPANARCWLPQLVYRLYARTPSVMIGLPHFGAAGQGHKVECQGMDFGLGVPPVERAPVSSAVGAPMRS